VSLESQPKPIGVRILLGLVALAMSGGVIVLFIPMLTSKGQSADTGASLFKVNGEGVTQAEVDRMKSGSAIFTQADTPSVLGDDIKTLMMGVLVQGKTVSVDAAKIIVSDKEVSDTINKIRKDRQLEDTQKWTEFLSQIKLTDLTARQEIRRSLAQQKRIEEIRKGVTTSDAEAKLIFELYPEKFRSEAKVIARQIKFSDHAKADVALKAITSGADFAKTATANGAASGGLVGGDKGAGALSFPAAVSTAVFALKAGQVSDVIVDGKDFYVVKVEKTIAPVPKTYEEAKTDLTKQVKTLKENGALEVWQHDLLSSAKLESTDAKWTFNNPVIATVEGQAIYYFELINRLYSNQQIQQMLQSGQADPSILNTFKPTILDGLIREKVAVALAAKDKLAVSGPSTEVINQVGLYHTKDFKLSEDAIKALYEKTKDNYKMPGSATLIEGSFPTKAGAEAFRKTFLLKPSSDFTQAVMNAGGTANELGKIADAEQRTAPQVSAAVFTGKLQAAGAGNLSEVVEIKTVIEAKNPEVVRYTVGYVTNLVKPKTQSYAEVRDTVKSQAETQERQKALDGYFKGVIKDFKVENKLKEVMDVQAKRVAAAAPKSVAPTAPTGAAPTASTPAGTAPATSAATGSAPATTPTTK
jgi:parvulin-like peptidyl-prolyl isomerase